MKYALKDGENCLLLKSKNEVVVYDPQKTYTYGIAGSSAVLDAFFGSGRIITTVLDLTPLRSIKSSDHTDPANAEYIYTNAYNYDSALMNEEDFSNWASELRRKLNTQSLSMSRETLDTLIMQLHRYPKVLRDIAACDSLAVLSYQLNSQVGANAGATFDVVIEGTLIPTDPAGSVTRRVFNIKAACIPSPDGSGSNPNDPYEVKYILNNEGIKKNRPLGKIHKAGVFNLIAADKQEVQNNTRIINIMNNSVILVRTNNHSNISNQGILAALDSFEPNVSHSYYASYGYCPDSTQDMDSVKTVVREACGLHDGRITITNYLDARTRRTTNIAVKLLSKEELCDLYEASLEQLKNNPPLDWSNTYSSSVWSRAIGAIRNELRKCLKALKDDDVKAFAAATSKRKDRRSTDMTLLEPASAGDPWFVVNPANCGDLANIVDGNQAIVLCFCLIPQQWTPTDSALQNFEHKSSSTVKSASRYIRSKLPVAHLHDTLLLCPGKYQKVCTVGDPDFVDAGSVQEMTTTGVPMSELNDEELAWEEEAKAIREGKDTSAPAELTEEFVLPF